MYVNKKRLICITLSLFLSIVALCFAAGCSSSSLPTSSISGVLSVPITGDQHYETNGSFGDDFSDAYPISYCDTAYGTIETVSDVDYFSFSGSGGDTVIIDIDAEAIGSELDSVLSLYYESDKLNPIAENDDYPPGWQNDPANYIFVYDSHIEWNLTSSGTHYIMVKSHNGNSSGSYQLRLFDYSSGGSLAEEGDIPPDVEFVPDEIIVKYKPGFDSGSVKGVTLDNGYAVLKSNRDRVNGALELLKISKTAKVALSPESAKEKTIAEVRRLRTLPHVEYAEPNYIMKPLFIPNDTYYFIDELQWHYPLIKLDMVWDENLQNDLSSLRVAVLDTGIARSDGTSSGTDHPDLGNFVDEYDFIRDPLNSLDDDGIDGDATDPGDDPNGQFSSFHGTHVIGTIGALTNNGTGIAGVAGGNNSGVQIMPLRVLGARGGDVYDIAQAVRYAAGLSNDSGFQPSPAHIINMSLGAAVDTATLRNAISDAYDAGVLIVASAGNEGSSTAFYPAAYSNVISVSAVGPGSELAPYSSYGGSIEICAPGGDTGIDITFDGYPDGVLSTLFDQNGSTYTPLYSFYQGTSMAAPHVSGVAALMLAANGSLTPAEVRSKLATSAIDLGQEEYDIYYGHGLVNAYAAVKAAFDPPQTQSPVLCPFPRALKLEGSNPTDSFTLKNIGESGPIAVGSITAIDDPESMISNITPNTDFPVDDTGQNINVTLSTSGVEDGKTHYARLEVTYDPSMKEHVYVLYNRDGITSFYENEDIGNVFVLALDPLTFETVSEAVTTFSESYEYTIGRLPAGSYIIAAGTDRDCDLSISDAGEALGFYPVYGTLLAIEVDGAIDLTGVDFQVIDNASAGPGGLGFFREQTH
jgi:serine protease